MCVCRRAYYNRILCRNVQYNLLNAAIFAQFVSASAACYRVVVGVSKVNIWQDSVYYHFLHFVNEWHIVVASIAD